MKTGIKKILTIDDDEDIRLTLSEMLHMEGYETLWAKNGLVALDYLHSIPDQELPDLVLLDYMMPVMNGESFFQEKAKHPRLSKIPVVMMTANGNLIHVMDKVPTKAFMSKPMEIETVVNTIQHFLGPNQQLEQTL